MMRAVVTGASGMLGAHVVKKLLEDGWDVISVIRPGSLRKRPWTTDILRETEIIEADITQPVSLPQSDVLVHTAGVMHGRALDVNYRGTLNVIRSANTRWFVLISSILALGDSLRESAREDQKCKPVTEYEISKYMAEIAAFKAFGEKVTIIRPVWMYGPYTTNPDIIYLAKLVKMGISPVIISQDLRIAMVHARDVACAVSSLIGESGVFNVRGPRMYAFGELIHAIETFYKKRGIRIVVPRKIVSIGSMFFDIARYLLLSPDEIPIDKLKDKYSPKIDLKEGIEETLEWLESQAERSSRSLAFKR
jgi:nucleoside-diphosphate-sugar epimerase